MGCGISAAAGAEMAEQNLYRNNEADNPEYYDAPGSAENN
jgi:hypothetical protein